MAPNQVRNSMRHAGSFRVSVLKGVIEAVGKEFNFKEESFGLDLWKRNGYDEIIITDVQGQDKEQILVCLKWRDEFYIKQRQWSAIWVGVREKCDAKRGKKAEKWADCDLRGLLKGIMYFR